MANYVLVHGAWGGGLTWGAVPARLKAEGHEVLVATLPGLGTRQDELHPGITLTDLARVAWDDPKKGGPMLARTPVGRFAETDDVAEVILFLLSDQAAMLNGLALPLEGGFLVN